MKAFIEDHESDDDLQGTKILTNVLTICIILLGEQEALWASQLEMRQLKR